jgi:sugar-specific transcriptional regulator TrmB
MSKNIDENIENNILDDLFSLGLKGKEAQIYLALLKLGEVGTTKICRETSLHRQFVYQFLDSLEKKGLVQHVLFRGRKRFSAKNPEVLSSLLEQKKKVTERLIQNVKKVVTVPQEQVTELNQGDDSYVISAFKLLEETKEGSTILIISGKGDRYINILGDRFIEYERLRKKKNILIKYIGSSSQKDELENRSRGLFDFRLLQGDFSDITNTVIFPELITLDTFGVPVTQTIVYNPAVADGYKEFFDALWDLAK